MAKQKSKGREQKAKTPRSKLAAPNLNAYYDKAIHALEPGAFTFRTILIRPAQPRDSRYMTLDRATTTLEWNDSESSSLSGSLSLQRPSPEEVGALPILRGDRVRLQLFWGGQWRTMWDMMVSEPPPASLPLGSISVSLADPLAALQANVKQWEFKKDKRHPDGWTADEITRFVCKDQHCRIARLPQGKVKIKKLKLKGSGLEVIRRAWAREKKKTTLRYVIKFVNGHLDVVPFGRPETMTVIGGIAKQAETEATGGGGLHPTTSIKATGHLKLADGKTKKIEEVVTSKSAAKRLGFSQKEHNYGKVDSRSELREEAQRDLSSELELKHTATLTIPGIPFLEKGSTVKWLTNEPGWHGKVGKSKKDRAIAFVTGTTHTLSPQAYETSLALSQQDIYLADAERRDEERRQKKQKEREGRKGKKANAEEKAKGKSKGESE